MSKRQELALKETPHYSIDGKRLNLKIVRHGKANLCFEFTVHNLSTIFHNTGGIGGVVLIITTLLACMDFNFSSKCLLCLLVIVIAYLLWKLLWTVKSESVLLVAPIGIQLTASFQLGHQTSEFIPWHHISDVIINEAITLHRVVYYLAVLVDYPDTKKARLIPLFQHTRPRLALLEEVYQSVQKLFVLERGDGT